MRVFLILLGLFSATCALPRFSRIIGGEDTNIETYPFMAGMLGYAYDGIFNLGCGATLISPTSVVSAAHCFEDVPIIYLRVRLGTDRDTSGGVVHIISKTIIHPEYVSPTLLNDIRILRLRDPAVYSNQIQAARIAGPNYHLPADTVVYALGWGDVQYGGPHSPILQHVGVNVIDHQICTERHAYLKSIREHGWYDITPDMLCTGVLDVGGKDACYGDSGGPVIHNNDVLVGITSFGYECAHPKYPGVNTRISSYTEWIYVNSVSNNTV